MIIIDFLAMGLTVVLTLFVLFKLCVMIPRIAWIHKQRARWTGIVGEYCNWLRMQGRYDKTSTFEELILYMHNFDWIYKRFWIRDFNKLFKDDRFKDVLNWYNGNV